jgi:hypothetical protein
MKQDISSEVDIRSAGQKNLSVYGAQDSLLCSEETVTGPYPEAVESNPHIHAIFSKGVYLCYPPIYAEVSEMVSSLQLRPK